MLGWKIGGVKIGTYCDASVLNDLPDFDDVHTFAGKTVRRLDDDTTMGDVSVGGYFSVSCAISATKKMKKIQLRELLDDKSLFNTKRAPSLKYIEVGSKVYVCVIERICLA